MAEYNSDEERLTAIMDFLKRNQRIILLTFGVVFFTAITSVSVNSYYANQNAQAAELYDAWFIDTLEETNDLEKKSFYLQRPARKFFKNWLCRSCTLNQRISRSKRGES